MIYFTLVKMKALRMILPLLWVSLIYFSNFFDSFQKKKDKFMILILRQYLKETGCSWCPENVVRIMSRGATRSAMRRQRSFINCTFFLFFFFLSIIFKAEQICKQNMCICNKFWWFSAGYILCACPKEIREREKNRCITETYRMQKEKRKYNLYQ